MSNVYPVYPVEKRIRVKCVAYLTSARSVAHIKVKLDAI